MVLFSSDMLMGLVIATKPYSYDGTLTSFAVKFIDFPLDLTWQIDKILREHLPLVEATISLGQGGCAGSEMCQSLEGLGII